MVSNVEGLPDLQAYSGYELTIVLVVFGVLIVLFTALRFVARRLAHNPFGPEDALILAGVVVAFGFFAVCAVMLMYGGVGYHLQAVMAKDPGKIVVWLKCLLAAPILYLNAVAYPKLAVLVLFHRIFPQLWLRRTAYTVGALIIATLLATTLTAVLHCRPLEKFWNHDVPGSCVDTNAFFTWASFPNIVTDLIMLIMPLPVIWRLHNTTAVKVGLAATFLTGSLGLITSIVRFAGFAQSPGLTDGTWSSVDLLIWSAAEISTYIIAACLPHFRPLLRYIDGKRKTASGGFRSDPRRNEYNAKPVTDNVQPKAYGKKSELSSKPWRDSGWERLEGGVGTLTSVSGAGAPRHERVLRQEGLPIDESLSPQAESTKSLTGIHVKHEVIISTSARKG